MSSDLKKYLHEKGVATSRTTPYNPQGNGLVERYNGTIWKAVTLTLKARNLPPMCWEIVIPDALHSIRSVISTSTQLYTKGCLILNDVHQLEHLYQHGFLTQDLFFLRDMYHYQNMIP